MPTLVMSSTYKCCVHTTQVLKLRCRLAHIPSLDWLIQLTSSHQPGLPTNPSIDWFGLVRTAPDWLEQL